jgi:hypothetical protein
MRGDRIMNSKEQFEMLRSRLKEEVEETWARIKIKEDGKEAAIALCEHKTVDGRLSLVPVGEPSELKFECSYCGEKFTVAPVTVHDAVINILESKARDNASGDELIETLTQISTTLDRLRKDS